jgi:hypothetical protein
MDKHWHSDALHILFYGASAILVINLTRFAAAKMATSDWPPLAWVGEALGGTVHWGG